MQLTRFFRHAAGSPLRAMLDAEPIRRRVIFDLKQRYFNELDIEIPLGFGLKAPVSSQQAWCSFEEIFFAREYQSSLDNLLVSNQAPSRWIDLGCHVGYFSLWLLYERLRRGLSNQDCQAVLIDADPQIANSVKKLISINNLGNQFHFAPYAISAKAGTTPFAVRGYMASSLAELGAPSDVRLIDTIDQKGLISLMPPPYDLVKIDIEGAEYEFFTSYQEILKATKHIILEWHSWHTGGGGAQQLRELAQERNFKIVAETTPQHTEVSETEQSGIFLLENTRC